MFFSVFSNEHCQWVITTRFPQHIIQVESVATDLVNWDGGECEDYVAAYDGKQMKITYDSLQVFAMIFVFRIEITLHLFVCLLN